MATTVNGYKALYDLVSPNTRHYMDAVIFHVEFSLTPDGTVYVCYEDEGAYHMSIQEFEEDAEYCLRQWALEDGLEETVYLD